MQNKLTENEFSIMLHISVGKDQVWHSAKAENIKNNKLSLKPLTVADD